jgi:hypothetical protein
LSVVCAAAIIPGTVLRDASFRVVRAGVAVGKSRNDGQSAGHGPEIIPASEFLSLSSWFPYVITRVTRLTMMPKAHGVPWHRRVTPIRARTTAANQNDLETVQNNVGLCASPLAETLDVRRAELIRQDDERLDALQDGHGSAAV